MNYVVLDNVFTRDWCQNIITRFKGGEMAIGGDRYGRHDFIGKDIAQFVKAELLRKVDISKFKVSHRFYMNKYYPNSSFIGKHVDGHITNGSDVSAYSVIIYLNDCQEGETVLYDKETVRVAPVCGRVLLMKQDILHEGLPPLGYKYILRTDLMLPATEKKDS